jgi:riboflavin synthase
MFTGIATNIGVIDDIIIKKEPEYIIKTDMDFSKLKLGSSILCSGICLTVVKKRKNKFAVNISEETLKSTTASSWTIGKKVNLEKSLCMGDELGGHIVTGHVDQTSKLIKKKILDKSISLNFYLPSKLRKFICRKGSIAIDGISLTINDVFNKNFFVSLIPHTADITTLGELKENNKVNIEIDVLARYIDNNINLKR